jgi:hypothetical protein
MRWISSIARFATRPVVATYGSMALLFVGLVVDLNSDQALVVSIIYNIPIVVSAVLLTRTLTVWTIVLSLAANAAAGYANAIDVGETSGFTVANRVLVGLSFLLVGSMTLLFERSRQDVHDLEFHEEDGERERALRHVITDLSGPLTRDEILRRATVGLRELLHADAVVFTGLDGDRFVEPRWSAPEFTSVAEPGKLATWAVDALPVTTVPVIMVRTERGLTGVGRLAVFDDVELIVVVSRPDRTRASQLLGEAIMAIEPLCARAAEFERLHGLSSD